MRLGFAFEFQLAIAVCEEFLFRSLPPASLKNVRPSHAEADSYQAEVARVCPPVIWINVLIDWF
jgi:hypothetical protein